MTTISIDKLLKQKLPEFHVGVVNFECNVKKSNVLDEQIKRIQDSVRGKYILSDVLTLPHIFDARNGYKKLGKDPSRYRLAVESLFRRIIKGNDLYRINDVVDIGNVLSLLTKRSIAVLDRDKIVGDIIFRIGKAEPYEGIGRGAINIENIPVYCDNIGPFGNPTSDTERTMITDTTKKILLFIIAFDGLEELTDNISLCLDLYQKYTDAKNFYTKII